jgi:hypothetical protein
VVVWWCYGGVQWCGSGVTVVVLANGKSGRGKSIFKAQTAIVEQQHEKQ